GAPQKVAPEKAGAAGDEDRFHGAGSIAVNTFEASGASGRTIPAACPGASVPFFAGGFLDSIPGRRPRYRPGAHRVPARQLLGAPDPGALLPRLARPGAGF